MMQVSCIGTRVIRINGIILIRRLPSLDMYYDLETGRKALLIGVTIGPGNNRHHSIYSIGQRGVNQFLKTSHLKYQ